MSRSRARCGGSLGNRTLTVHNVTLFSLAHVFNCPCLGSGKTSLNIPVIGRLSAVSDGPTQGAMTRYCARVVSSLGGDARLLDNSFGGKGMGE